MSKIDYQALREAAEKATKGSYIVGHTSVNQHGNLTGVFVCQKWKGEPGGVIAECHVNCLVKTDVQAYANAEFIAAFNPNVALALLDERERNQQYIKRRDQENEDIALTVGKLRVELESAEKRIAELEAEPVSQTYKLPQTQFEQVADLYEMQFDDGRTCAFHTDVQKAAQWLQTCDGNRVQEYVKLERLRNALSGNSPVTPDGWISCSERMPEDTKMLLAFSQGEIVAAYWNWVVNPIDYKKYRAFTYLSGNILDDVTHWMPLPEPPQHDGE
ncbi:ead/Ea22-like family protein [Escherichia coli]|uniref:ead/Ea22-like family protein n=3 Tax=Enterobacteriaceae TaxID=543 RepID=UPI0022E6F3E7|nr:ead/Ea22-like family protein [Escherichia coli]